jgi:hypothetical protein
MNILNTKLGSTSHGRTIVLSELMKQAKRETFDPSMLATYIQIES